jgi:cobalt-zinc-cadmium efflux system membrane fusion protein
MKIMQFSSVLGWAALGLVLFGCSTAEPPAAAAEHPHDSIRLEPGNPHLNFIKVAPVSESDAGAVVRLTGKVGFDENHTQRLASPIDGRATKILAQPGDLVKAGQALVELTSPHVSELQADAQKAAQDLDVAKRGVDRAQKLRQDGAVSEKEAAQAEADFLKAKADYARATAQLKSLSVSATDPTTTAALRTQVAGTIVERNVLMGQEVRADATDPLFTISDLRTVWVLADVYEQDLGLVQRGAHVKISVAAYPGEAFPGEVEHVADVVDANSRTVKVRCSVPNPDLRLKPEMFANIELDDIQGKKVITLPARAVLTDAEHSVVLVAGNDDVYRPRVVTVGPEVGGHVRVLDGLKAGENVVTDGAVFLKHEMEGD